MVELTQEEGTCEIWSIGVCVTDKVGYRPAAKTILQISNYFNETFSEMSYIGKARAT